MARHRNNCINCGKGFLCLSYDATISRSYCKRKCAIAHYQKRGKQWVSGMWVNRVKPRTIEEKMRFAERI